MKIIVNGCGKVGENLIASFIAEGYDVVALDNDPAVITEITNVHDAICVVGNSTDCETLEQAGAKDCDLFVALTGSDELNMLSCFLAKRMGAKHTIARIRNPEYNDESLGFMKHELGLSMAVNPELLAAREIFDILGIPSAAKVETFNGRSFEILELKLKEDSILDGMSLKDIRSTYKSHVLICAVQRGDEVFIPGGDFVLHSSDKIGITASRGQITDFLRKIGLMAKQAKNVMILGGSRTAFYLAKMLDRIGSNVKLIELDKEIADRLSEELESTSVVLGNGTEQEILMEEGVASSDAFVSLTGMDEQNILMAKFAEAQNVPKVIAKVNRNELAALADKIGLDCIISPKKIVESVLVQYARALDASGDSSVETLYKLMDGKIEALEFYVKTESKITGIPLKELTLKENVLVAGILRGRKTIVPGGDDVILSGDRVIVLAGEKKLRDLADALA